MGSSILRAIGNTSLVQLSNVVPPGCAKVFGKLEWENPTGSMKDRMAQAMISRAEEDGRLKSGDTIVEYTGGSTGISLALICVAKGYRLHIITSDAFSQDKLNQMAAFDAELTLVPSEGGLTTKKLILDMIDLLFGQIKEQILRQSLFCINAQLDVKLATLTLEIDRFFHGLQQVFFPLHRNLLVSQFE